MNTAESLLTISGHGTIERDKWEAMANTIDSRNFNFGHAPENEQPPSWLAEDTFDIQFVVENATPSEPTINLPNDSSLLFCQFDKQIFFGNNQVGTANVTNMSAMFHLTPAFNQPIPFDTSQVTDISGMFAGAASFNQPIDIDAPALLGMAFFAPGSALRQLRIMTAGNVAAENAFGQLANLRYLEFSGLLSAAIDGFSADYRVENMTAGTTELKAGDDAYQFADNAHYRVTLQSAKNITNCAIAVIPEQEYNGNHIVPSLTITDGDYALINDIDYTVEFTNNIEVGTFASKRYRLRG
ncbi:MAG: hypothetical protein CR995_00445 [Clostridiales bacterium]|nr:MAG: hypothetical protein CR995_00445 [Clostridiales bacterium]